MRNKIYAIVEGKGEANSPSKSEQPAALVLIQRLLNEENQCFTLFPSKRPPFRLNYGQLFHRENKLENTIRAHKQYSDCAGILILCDMDDDCPVEEAKKLRDRILKVEELPFSIAIAFAQKEYEGWFLASLPSIHEGETYDGNCEDKRDAKGWLRKRFGYRQTRDQSKYTRMIDIELACENSRSFRRACHAIEELVQSIDQNMIVITPVLSADPT